MSDVSSLESLDYVSCFEAMRRCKLTFSPTEAHAIAVGLLVGDVPAPEQQWAASMYADLDPADALAQECRHCLDQLFQTTIGQAGDLGPGLQLFMPPQVLNEYDERMALRDWAQGFLYGFGLAGQANAARLSPEGQEALRDFYEIGNMEIAAQAPDEEEQQALAEIEEYVRVAAMLIHEDMHAPRPTGEVSHEVH